jgi:hypothetical protein
MCDLSPYAMVFLSSSTSLVENIVDKFEIHFKEGLRFQLRHKKNPSKMIHIDRTLN